MTQMKHHVIVIGAGSIGHRHIRCFGDTKRTAVSFVEPREEIRREIESLYPNVRSFASLDEISDWDQFDAAVIATTAPQHLTHAQAMLERGINVLIEKPLAVDVAEAEAFSRTAEAHGKVIAVAYVYRANPLLVQMRDAIRSGEYGKPLEFIAYGGQHFPTYRPAYRETYYRSHESGGGAIQDALTHVFNVGQFLVGPMEKIVVDADHQVLDGVEVEDTVHALARHRDGVMASYVLNQHQPANEMTMTVVCERGQLRMENHRERWRVCTAPDTDWRDFSLPVPLLRDELFVRQADAFLDAIEGKAAPLCDLQEGLQTLRMNVAAISSWRGGQWEAINHQCEK
ncbi:1,5-anhydro-D-fructose reductase [Novipirellula galeiformis]|uniref:1,5-anhydro-D-fructose reductase n=2 Tax=Novipirellula galeiformis TaxID=2528004 RepID=A0A5C6CP97_9BACT|nr:1,5-anhydro-D-fructose reductase [Novipirellula galeiformis]